MPRTAVSRLGALVAAAALGAVLLVASALPAAAHDEIVGTDPAADATLETLPDVITLTFSADLLDEPGATQLQVTDADGIDLLAGDPAVSGVTITAALDGSAEGAVTVLWRVVSSDGHPISGEYAFTVAPPVTSPPTTEATTPVETPSEAPVETPDETATPVATDDSTTSVTPLLVVAGIVGVGSLGALVAVLVARARGAGGRGSDGP